jgi:transposase
MADSSVLLHRQVVQAQALLWAADGVANEEIARRSRVDSDTVRRWRNRFTDKASTASAGSPRGRGRKPWLPADTVQRVVELTLTGEPPGGANRIGPPEPWPLGSGWAKDGRADLGRSQTALGGWTLSRSATIRSPRRKLVDVVGMYLKPPARAVVFSFDEKTQCQALDRTQPSLPLKPGRAGTMTHDYKRHGTIGSVRRDERGHRWPSSSRSTPPSNAGCRCR